MVRLHVRRSLLLVGALYLSGCYSYVPTDLSELPVGRPIRVQLSRQAFADMPQISDRQGTRLEGTLVRRSDAGLTVNVPISIGSELGQELTFPAIGIVQSDLRVLSKAKSAAVVASAIALVVTVVAGTHTGKPIVANNSDNPTPQNEGYEFRGGARISPIARALSFSIPLF